MRTFVGALIAGSGLDEAVREAELDPEVAVEFLDSIRSTLGSHSVSRPTPRAGQPHRPAGGPGEYHVEHVTAICDGASRGNPGEAACAAILSDDEGQELLRRSKRLGVVTNNVAEYEGVILALDLAASLKARRLLLKLDSELVVRQLNLDYKVRNATLKPLFDKARLLMRSFEAVEVTHVPRADTRPVDKLANDALDGKGEE